MNAKQIEAIDTAMSQLSNDQCYVDFLCAEEIVLDGGFTLNDLRLLVETMQTLQAEEGKQ